LFFAGGFLMITLFADQRGTRKRLGFVAAGVGLTALAAIGLSGERAARAQQGEANAALTPPLAVNWKFSSNYFPNNSAAPTMDATTAYFGQGNRFFAVNKETGALKWQYPADKSTLTTIITATPTVSDGTVYFSAADGVYALDAETGKQKWAPFTIRTGVYTNIAVYQDTILFGGSNSRLYALDAKTGTPRPGAWSTGGRPGLEVGDFITDLVVAEDNIYFITSDQVLHSFSLVTGARRWAVRLTGAGIRTSTPVVSGEFLYIAAGNRLLNVRRNNGQVRWQIALPAEAAGFPAVDPDGNCYVATANRNVFAIDIRGRGIWKFGAATDNEILSAPAYADKTVFVTTTQGGVWAFDAATGNMAWNYTVEPTSSNPNTIPTLTNIAARPVVSEGSLYVLSDDGALTSFRADAPDTLAPRVTNVFPAQGEYLSGRPPFTVRAKVLDEGSGLKMDTLSVKIDDRSIPRRPAGRDNIYKPGFYYAPESQTVTYTIQEGAEGQTALRDGHHTATISVSDWKGNVTTKTWSFTIDDTIPRRTTRPSTGTGIGGGRPPGAGGGGNSGDIGGG
jgi:eukaryotic-like serine/threonine-protein kinase